jgi:hypothetical protein
MICGYCESDHPEFGAEHLAAWEQLAGVAMSNPGKLLLVELGDDLLPIDRVIAMDGLYAGVLGREVMQAPGPDAPESAQEVIGEFLGRGFSRPEILHSVLGFPTTIFVYDKDLDGNGPKDLVQFGLLQAVEDLTQGAALMEFINNECPGVLDYYNPMLFEMRDGKMQL